MMLMVATGVVTLACFGAWLVVQKEIQKRKRTANNGLGDEKTTADGSNSSETDTHIDRSVRTATTGIELIRLLIAGM